MGTTAEKIARTIGLQAKSPVIDLASHRTARQLLRDARLEGDEIKKLISEGYDPSHAVYIYAQNLTSVLAEQLSTTKDARQYAKVVGDAQDIYMPSYPPMSPLTTSYFNMWAFFDVLFGQSHETIGTCLLRIAEVSGLPIGLRDVLAAMQRSRMAIYAHCGTEGRFVRLRELGSQRTGLCLVPTGYQGTEGEVWFVRVLPAVHTRFEYQVVFTTPYILRNTGEREFNAYLDRERGRLGSKILPRKMDVTTFIMKHGPTANHWNEYIFCAYVGHQHDAVFLTGIPDIKESLPHG
jgi:hypothetical protein